jgi:hypothetical protein
MQPHSTRHVRAHQHTKQHITSTHTHLLYTPQPHTIAARRVVRDERLDHLRVHARHAHQVSLPPPPTSGAMTLSSLASM